MLSASSYVRQAMVDTCCYFHVAFKLQSTPRSEEPYTSNSSQKNLPHYSTYIHYTLCMLPTLLASDHSYVYHRIWFATIGEVLSYEREPTNSKDRYAVTVKKDETVIGHLPRKVSRVCSLFLRRGGTVHCQVSGSWSYSSDLPQGGLEIPCEVIISAKPKEIKKLKRSLKTWGTNKSVEAEAILVIYRKEDSRFRVRW